MVETLECGIRKGPDGREKEGTNRVSSDVRAFGIQEIGNTQHETHKLGRSSPREGGGLLKKRPGKKKLNKLASQRRSGGVRDR